MDWLFFSLWLQNNCRRQQTGLSYLSQRPISPLPSFSSPVAYLCETTFFSDNELRGILAWQFAIISIANLCGMAADRYVAIVTPFKYVRFMSSNRVFFLIGSAWGLPLLLYLPPNLYIHFAGANEKINFFYKSSMGSCLRYCPVCFCYVPQDGF